MAEYYSGPWIPYSEYIKRQAAGEINLATDTIKMCLLNSSYIPDLNNHATYSDVSSYEISVSGYSTGGSTISGKNIIKRDGTSTWDADIASFGPFLDPQLIHYGVLYDDSHSEKILIAYCLLNANDEDVETVRFFMMFEDGIINFNRN